jgi:hypothetical protein
LDIHEGEVIVASCPHCGGGNLFHVQGEVGITQIPNGPGGEAETNVADSISRVSGYCYHCEEGFFLTVRKLEEGGWAIAAETFDRLVQPEEKVEELDLHYDDEKQAWEKIVDGKAAGQLSLSPKGSR